MKTTVFISLSVLIFAGCATTPDDLAECNGADWYKIGRRDGQAGRSSQLEARSAQCVSFGVKPDAAQYEKGLRDGHDNHASVAAQRRVSLF